MTVHVEPLDPASPLGVELASRLTEVLGRIQAAIWARQATRDKPPPPPPPGRQPPPTNPSRPPPQPTRPTGPPGPPRRGSAALKQAAQPASGGSGAAVHIPAHAGGSSR